MTFVLQYWFVSRLGYPETFASTCQNDTGEFLSEVRCEYTFNILFTTITVAFLALFPFIISKKLPCFIIGCLWLGLLWLLGSVFITFDSTYLGNTLELSSLFHYAWIELKIPYIVISVISIPTLFFVKNYDQRTSFSSICSCGVIAFF
ncbi:MAG: hypothetical protein E6Z57_04865 [Haemophilus parainfluenzae]|nr:hypothetical protein [Haemophilus parainfluenzae]